MSEIQIPIDSVKNDFKKRLEIENNNRILFSGRYGIGKTTFLNNFFEENKDTYDVYHLYPVNYQINSNEDVVEFVKFDLLMEVLKKYPGFLDDIHDEKTKNGDLLFLEWMKEGFGSRNLIKVAATATEVIGGIISAVTINPIPVAISKIARPLVEVLNIEEKYSKYVEKNSDNKVSVVSRYITDVSKLKISETDLISEVLKAGIANNKQSKKAVLVLDDLDRLDPEHIFRMLNVFSAIFERGHANAFGFDCVIIVADYRNIKSVFHHKYGQDADFDGYIDKYYSISPYIYDNRRAILNLVEDISKIIMCSEEALKDALSERGYIKLFMNHIFYKAVEADTINLRQLLKATKYILPENSKGHFSPG
jgi:hypothetical protein